MNDYKSHVYDPRKRCYVRIDSQTVATGPTKSLYARFKQFLGYTFLMALLFVSLAGLYDFAQSFASAEKVTQSIELR